MRARARKTEGGCPEHAGGGGAQPGPCSFHESAPALREGKSGVLQARNVQKESDAPIIAIACSEQEKEGEKSMPILLAADNRTRMITATVAPSKGVVLRAVDVSKRMVEQLGRKKAIMRSDNEPAILALKEAVG